MKVHFIGIGGIGVSAIARMMLFGGHEVTGSDVSTSIITDQLIKLGAKVAIGQNRDNIKKPDLVIYTSAIGNKNEELAEVRRLKIPIYSYPEILGKMSVDKYTIAIAGTHGKTTTTAMIGKILMDAKLSPTVIVGSLLKDKKSNFVSGRSNYLVVEACEYKRSFLNINPIIAVITNIDNDHLDYYGNISGVIKGFSEFAAKLPKDGYLVCDSHQPHIVKAIKHAKCKVVDYTKLSRNFRLKIPGDHNLNNAQAASAVAKILKVSQATIKKSLEGYLGTWRRFEYKGKTKNGALVYDDYAHHPTEIKATLTAARQKFGSQKIICVFQPHLFSRTKLLLNDFARSFGDADEVIVGDIYAAREYANDNRTGVIKLVQKISKYHPRIVYGNSPRKILSLLTDNVERGNVVFTMGAGDVYKIGERLLRSKS
ncbi:MAG: UDP-N-acetylmuramate--L-alanine ligase [bacterium]|nr:UDP-N-acetylmuramate--L-alanine ligase [bacterium]